MASWDSAYLLADFNRLIGRAGSGDSMSDAEKYVRLSQAQHRVMEDMLAVAPHMLAPTAAMGSLPTLTTSDNNRFTFGNDVNGHAVAPMGKALIFPSLADFPDSPWIEGEDYVSEGTQIRLPNNRTFGGTLYWYGVTPPADISASTQPTLHPAAFRDLIVLDAVARYAEESGRDQSLADRMRARFAERWRAACLAWKTQYSAGRGLRISSRRNAAYR